LIVRFRKQTNWSLLECGGFDVPIMSIKGIHE
jgi:hypothetical protein